MMDAPNLGPAWVPAIIITFAQQMRAVVPGASDAVAGCRAVVTSTQVANDI
jgi:hypothetical protein